MDITVYLPDEIGERAKAAELNLSRMLRDAVTRELERRTTVAKTLEGAEEIRLALHDDQQRPYVGRIVGRMIADDWAGGTINQDGYCVYLTEDDRIIAYLPRFGAYTEHETIEELRDELSGGAYAQACRALGVEPVVDL